MSFYGSVYYQLIDTFYKIVLKNSGWQDTSVLEDSEIMQDLESKAVGRKGVFGFDAGNRWINFGATETKDVDGEEQSVYKIYHGKPDPNPSKVATGFQVVEATGNEEVLDYEDSFKVSEIKYDNAGHISTVTEHFYKLPAMPETDLTLEEIKGQVAELQGKDQQIQESIQTNADEIAELQRFNSDNVGKWQDTNGYSLTIADAIGEVSKISGNHEIQSISDVLGNLSTFWKNDGTLVSLTEILQNQQEALNTLSTRLNTYDLALEGLSSRIDNLEKNQ